MDFLNGNDNNGGNFAEFLILLMLLNGQNGGLFGNNRTNDITNEWQTTQSKLDGITASTNAGFSNTQMGFAALAQQLSKCCCDNQLLITSTSNDTNRHIDQVLFQSIDAQTKNTQSIINRIDSFQDSLKDQQINDLRTQLAACTTRDTVGAMVAPLSNVLATIVARLDCGVKAVPYTPSLPVTYPFAYGPAQMPFNAYGAPNNC